MCIRDSRVLRKRLGRELNTNFARYLALVLLIVMGMYIIVSVVASAEDVYKRQQYDSI